MMIMGAIVIPSVHFVHTIYLFILCSAMSKFVNKAADGGITALHMASLNGYFDCVQLLLDLHANVSAVTFHYGTSMDLIGMFYAELAPYILRVASCSLFKLKLEVHLSRSWKHSIALRFLWGKFEMLSGKIIIALMVTYMWSLLNFNDVVLSFFRSSLQEAPVGLL